MKARRPEDQLMDAVKVALGCMPGVIVMRNDVARATATGTSYPAALEAMPAEARRARYHASLVHVGVSRRRMSPERARRWADEECAKRWP